MKKYLFLSILFLYLASAIAQNGNYIPFPSNMIVYTYENRANSDKGWYSVSRLEIQGDTLLNGFHYSKYFLAKVNKDGTSFPTSNLSGRSVLKGGIRNDISTKKVYLYSFSSNTEELLYDFDLHLGDTLFKNDGYKFYHSLLEDEFYPKIDTVWVSRVDSVLMPHDNLYHKRFNFETKYRIYTNKPYETITSDKLSAIPGSGFILKINPLIEGVGPDYNPISSYGHFEYHWDYQLFCRSIDKKISYADTASRPPFMLKANCNSIITGVDENEESGFLMLYPNPSNGKFDLTTGTSIKFFEICNLLGVKILSATIETNKMEIDISGQSSGIYFIRFFYRDGTSVTKKIMIE